MSRDPKDILEDYEKECCESVGKPQPRRKAIDFERERKYQLRLCSKDVRSMCRTMLKGKDRQRIADILGVKKDTLNDKVNLGRFSASEFLYMADVCGYHVEVVSKDRLMMI